MTNYEKIKSLSIDKMAEFLADNFEDGGSCQIKNWLKNKGVEGMTNYEKIKSLSGDEMAKFLKDNVGMSCKIMCPYIDEHGNCTDFSDNFDCIDALKDWLKAESEEEQITVKKAIKELRRQQSMMGVPASAEAIQIAISALEKEKEPAPQEAETSSNNNNSTSNDNTKLKECQEIIDNQIDELLDYYNSQISDDERIAFYEGQRYRELLIVQRSLKEAKK